MDSNKQHNPVSGYAYNVREMLGSDITLVIPDMQRDYCWGSDNVSEYQRNEKVTGFINGIIELYRCNTPSDLGIVYGYRHHGAYDYILIIDGQQRVTTLFLLIGMLYRRTKNPELRRILMSDYELTDDCEPKLLYQMRREALYFMSDLVINFFLNRDGRLSQIRHSNWYFSTYDYDLTVQSFIGALHRIDEALECAAKDRDWSFEDFSEFVVSSLRFLYFELPTRELAEEMFITINTTGEPLTQLQRSKASFLSAHGFSDAACKLWAEIEQWHWEHRPATSPDVIPEDEMAQFFDLYTSDTGISDIREARIKHLRDYFNSFRIVAQCADITSCNTNQGRFVVQPAIRYLMRFGLDADPRPLLRWLTNLTRYMRPSATDIAAAIKAVDELPQPDIISWLTLNHLPERIFSSEEIAKLRLLAANQCERSRVEQIIDKAQSHPMLNGRLEPMLAWCTDPHNAETDLRRLEAYTDKIYELWGTDIDCNPDLDNLRRALLALRHRSYPIVRRGETVMSLCWNDYDWQRLYALAPGLIRQLLDRTASSTTEQIISRFADRAYPYNFIIKSPSLIGSMRRRSLLRPCASIIGIPDDQGRTTWFVDQAKVKVDTSQWRPIRAYGSRCLYTDHRTLNVAIDLTALPDNEAYRIELFSRKDADRQTRSPYDLRLALSSQPVRFRFNRATSRFVAVFVNSRQALSTLHHLLTFIKPQS